MTLVYSLYSIEILEEQRPQTRDLKPEGSSVFFPFSSKMTLHFVQLVLGNKNYKDQVSSADCTHVSEFKDAIKNKYPRLLNSYDAAELTLFEPNGTTKIDSGEVIEKLNEFAAGPWNPLVVTAEELPIPAPIGSSKKQLTYQGMCTEASCRKYFDALAAKLALFYKFDWGEDSSFPTIGDVFKAVKEKTWKYQKRRKTLAERTNEAGYVEPPAKVPKLPTPLPELFDKDEWKRMKELNKKTTDRIHDATLPQEKGKFFIVVPAAEFNSETVCFLKGKLFAYEEDLIVKDEAL